MAKVKLEESRNLSMVSEHASNPPQTKFKIAKLPPFDDSKDSVDAYLIRFEKYHEAMKTDKGDWAIYLSALLKGKALEVYSRLSSFEASNYEILKLALLRRYQLTEEGLKRKFYSSSPEVGETCSQYMARLHSQLDKWLIATKVPKTYKDLTNLLVREQFLSSCDTSVAAHLREKQVDSNSELASLAERYLDAHGLTSLKSQKVQYHSNKFDRLEKVKDRKEPKFNKTNQETGGSKHEKNVKNCFLYGKSGDFAKDCFVKKKILAALIPDSGSDSDGSDSQSGDKSGSCNSQHDQSFGEKSTSLC